MKVKYRDKTIDIPNQSCDGDLKTIGDNMDNPKIENILKLNEYELINELPIPRTIKEIIYKINDIIEYINKEEK